MNDHDATIAHRWLFVGGSGRVGRMLRRAWQQRPASRSLIWQRRRGSAGGSDELLWDPCDGAAVLERYQRAYGALAGMLVFAGVTPAADANYAANPGIAEDCIRAAQAAGVPRLIVASSSAVYGATTTGDIPESAPRQPVNDYGWSKVAMEDACAAARGGALGITCLRIGNVLGADALLINAQRATAEYPLQVDQFPDGSGARRTYLGPVTLARVLEVLMAQSDAPEVLNVGLRKWVSMDALAERSTKPWVPRPRTDDQLQHITLDCSRLAALAPGLLETVGVGPMFDELETLGFWP